MAAGGKSALTLVTLDYPDGYSVKVKLDQATLQSLRGGQNKSLLADIRQACEAQPADLPDDISGSSSVTKEGTGSSSVGLSEVTKEGTGSSSMGLFDGTKEEVIERSGDITIQPWKHEEVLLLIDCYSVNKEKFKSSCYKKMDVWKKISAEMYNHGYSRMPIKCDEKFRSLKSRYREIKDRMKRSGNDRINWAYYELLDDLFQKDPSINPKHTISSDTTNKEENKSPAPPPAKKKKEVPEWFATHERKTEERFQEIKNMQMKLLETAQKRNDILQHLTEKLLSEQ